MLGETFIGAQRQFEMRGPHRCHMRGDRWRGQRVVGELSRRAASGETLADKGLDARAEQRSEEHTSGLQSLMRISYAVFCLKKQGEHDATNKVAILPTSNKVDIARQITP